MNKKKEILFNSNNFLLSLSILFDQVEIQKNKVSINHTKRVAYLSLKIGEKFNFSKEQLFDLCTYALAHNSALYAYITEDKEYCHSLQSFIDNFPLQSNETEVLKYHLERYNGSGIFGLTHTQIPLFSQIIGFANLIDTQFDLSKNTLENRTTIKDFVKENETILFSLDMSEIFCDELSIEEYFWLDLQHETQLLYYIFNTLDDFSLALPFESLLSITHSLTQYIHPQSQLSHKAFKMAQYYNFEPKDTITFQIAASLSMLGKLALPIEFKNKNVLNNEEYEQCKRYPYYTKMVLSNIMGFSDICMWASRVQECIDGSGYPYALKSNQLSFKDQLLSILVRYEALTNKNYQEKLAHEEAIKELEMMSKKGFISLSIVSDIKEALS